MLIFQFNFHSNCYSDNISSNKTVLNLKKKIKNSLAVSDFCTPLYVTAAATTKCCIDPSLNFPQYSKQNES